MTVGPLTVLVTGVGAPPGVSIMKALRQSTLSPRIVGVDADHDAIGLFRSDSAYVLPHAGREPEAYLDALSHVIEAEGVSLVCFGSEIEMLVVASARPEIEARTGARLVVNDEALLRQCQDKLSTIELLASVGMPVPMTVEGSDAQAIEGLLREHGFPVVVKPRRGSGSHGFHVVRDRHDLDLVLEEQPGSVVQEWLPADDTEHTVGAYRSLRQGFVGAIAFRRMLSAGVTYRADVVHDPEIDRVAEMVCERIGAWGPVNLQLRCTPDGPRIFEINLRFSSSAVMRAAFGYNEPELCLRDLLLGDPIPAPQIRDGRAMRYWDELYLDPGTDPVSTHEHAPLGRVIEVF